MTTRPVKFRDLSDGNVLIDSADCRQMRGSWWTANTGFSKARGCRNCKATQQNRPTFRTPSSRKSHEHLRHVHHRPIAAVLLIAGLLLGGLVTYRLLPALPCRTSLSRPGHHGRRAAGENPISIYPYRFRPKRAQSLVGHFPGQAERHSGHYRRDDGPGGSWPAPQRHCRSRGRIKLRHFTFSYRQYA